MFLRDTAGSPTRWRTPLFLHRAVRFIILRVADLASALPVEQRVSARLDESARVDESARRAKQALRGWEGEISSLFEHPEIILSSAPHEGFNHIAAVHRVFRSLLDLAKEKWRGSHSRLQPLIDRHPRCTVITAEHSSTRPRIQTFIA